MRLVYIHAGLAAIAALFMMVNASIPATVCVMLMVGATALYERGVDSYITSKMGETQEHVKTVVHSSVIRAYQEAYFLFQHKLHLRVPNGHDADNPGWLSVGKWGKHPITQRQMWFGIGYVDEEGYHEAAHNEEVVDGQSEDSTGRLEAAGRY